MEFFFPIFMKLFLPRKKVLPLSIYRGILDDDVSSSLSSLRDSGDEKKRAAHLSYAGDRRFFFELIHREHGLDV